ncbi:MAG: hypothetical protein CMF65_07495 [Magnetovibrio sp.]|nr:hypothetical protein [Magnetovibrio sp.]
MCLVILLPDVVVAQIKGSGLPLPRFVSLRATEVNMRAGPGVQYPVEWVYRRRNFPMEVVAEFGTWRKLRDPQDTRGWVHQSMLASRRTIVITQKIRSLRSRAASQSRPVAQLEPGVIARLLECPRESTWCRVRTEGIEGWLRRVEFWGVHKREVIE